MTGVHPTAIVAPEADLGSDVQIGPYCIVGSDVTLGDQVRLHSHVVVDGRTTIGAETVIYPFASIGLRPQDLKYRGEASELIVGARNQIREHVTMNPGTEGGRMETRVGNDCLFMIATHVAHDCIIGDHVVMANNATLGGHVEVGDYAIIGGLAAVHQFVRIGAHSMVGGMSGIEQDLIPVHDRTSEDAFVAAGHGAFRKDVMISQYLIVGPRDDPAKISGLTDAAAALRRIAATNTLFVSRGDDSGTHNAELRLWKAAGIDPRSQPGAWYRETGSGMGATLNIASALNAHVLTESGTWAKFANRGDLAILVDNALANPYGVILVNPEHNPYGVILVNPEHHPHILENSARKLIDWLSGPEAQKAIDDFAIDGQHPFRSATAAKARAN